MVRTEHRSYGLLYKMIGYNKLAYNENPLLTNEFSKTDSIYSVRFKLEDFAFPAGVPRRLYNININ